MRTSLLLFISRKIIGNSSSGKRVSIIIFLIAQIAVAFSISMMLISTSIGKGFQESVRDKVIMFKGHIQVINYDNINSEVTENSIEKFTDSAFLQQKISSVEAVFPYATKGAIIKTNDVFEGVILKGVGKAYDWGRIKKYIIEGRTPKFEHRFSNEIIISNVLFRKLNISLNQTIDFYFINQQKQKLPNRRKFKVVGVFESGFSQYDKLFVLGDITHIQRLNHWSEREIGGYEIYVNNFDELDKNTKEIFHQISSTQNARNIYDINPRIFEWLLLFDTNVLIIIFLMMMVSLINIVTVLLVLVLEKKKIIGILKTIGLNNNKIHKVFVYLTIHILIKGIVWGNIIAITLMFLQDSFNFIKLDKETYYVDSVPISLSFFPFLWINLLTIMVCYLALLIPSRIISKINIIKILNVE